MGRKCCIAGCNSKTSSPGHAGVTYHSYPLDPKIRAVWVRNTQLPPDRHITKSVLVCSRHFRSSDFQPMRSDPTKFLLRNRVFPTAFPWGKIGQAQIDADTEMLKTMGTNANALLSQTAATNIEAETKATVEAKVKQIFAEAAVLNVQGQTKPQQQQQQQQSVAKPSTAALVASPIAAAVASPTYSQSTPPTPAAVVTSTANMRETATATPVKFEAVTNFNPGSRLEAQDFDGIWHPARVVEVDNDDREVLIRFEKSNKIKSSVKGTEEWIPMNSTRLRQRVCQRPVVTFQMDEKCMARWSGPRKFPGTVTKVLGNDTYEVLFDDGYVKNVRAIHMSKFPIPGAEPTTAIPATPPQAAAAPVPPAVVTPQPTPVAPISPRPPVTVNTTTPVGVKKTVKRPLSAGGSVSGQPAKRRALPAARKDWPLLDMSKLDLAALNLPVIPRDGEWTCHWVNDQPIGKDGILIVGEHRKPTVIVEDWRLPPGWIKHMYQRSNVLGKWDVILVSPNGKRFRSKSDLKTYLEELGKVYNPDVYDFSIHRRRAKDINAYVFTSDYTPQHLQKPPLSELNSSTASGGSTTLSTTTASSAYATPNNSILEMSGVSTALSNELMLSSPGMPKTPPNLEPPPITASVDVNSKTTDSYIKDGCLHIGGLTVQIVDNLFRCPQEGCLKTFRKENHLKVHVRHYHQELKKLLGECPKMMDLAEKLTHTNTEDQNEPVPKNQIPNQEFFAKLHQQDLQNTRAHRRVVHNTPVTTAGKEVQAAVGAPAATGLGIKSPSQMKEGGFTENMSMTPGVMNQSSIVPPKRPRFGGYRRSTGSRRSNRQRTTRRFLTARHHTARPRSKPTITNDSNFGVSDFEETRHSFSIGSDGKLTDNSKKRGKQIAPATPMSSIDSPMTADSGSLQGTPSNDYDMFGTQYIKENGELIKIVRMRQEEIINCVCSYAEEDGLMIQCELCLCWQHGFCNGISKESEVPEKYVCWICRNPQGARDSMRYKHDQDWLYDGKLPVANYHTNNPELSKRFDLLKKSHSLTGNLTELKRFMHSLRVKINIAHNLGHPKLYLWAKKWDEESSASWKTEPGLKTADIKRENKSGELVAKKSATPAPKFPNIPEPEAPIKPVECQQRLLEHIKVQQNLAMKRLLEIEAEVDELEKRDDLPDLKNSDVGATKDVCATFIKELEIMKQIAKLNALERTKSSTSTTSH